MTRVHVLLSLIIPLAAALAVGCESPAHVERVDLGVFYGRVILSWGGGKGYISAGVEFFYPNDEVVLADTILWCLRNNPAILDRQWHATKSGPEFPRGRDIWASVLAQLKGVPFLVPSRECEADRDKRIQRLLKAIREKERGEAFYIDDFLEAIDFDNDGRVVQVNAEFDSDSRRAEFVTLALKWLRTKPSALKSLEGEENYDVVGGVRGRDIWAAVLAQVMGVNFDLLTSEPDEQRDKRIVGLIKELGKSGN